MGYTFPLCPCVNIPTANEAQTLAQLLASVVTARYPAGIVLTGNRPLIVSAQAVQGVGGAVICFGDQDIDIATPWYGECITALGQWGPYVLPNADALNRWFVSSTIGGAAVNLAIVIDLVPKL